MTVGRSADNGLFSAVMAVAAGLEITSTLRRIVQAAVDLSDARYGALGVLADEGGLAEFIEIGMDEATVAAIGPMPRGRGVLGLLLDHPVPLRMDDLTQHPESAGFPPNHPPMTTFLGVPVRVRGRVFGNLYLTEKRGGEGFTVEDERAVSALAAAAAVAIENARLFEATRMRARWLRAAREIDSALLSGASMEEVFGAITRQARLVTGADLATLALRDDDSYMVEFVDSDDGGDGLVGSACSVDQPPAWDGPIQVFPLHTAERAIGLLSLGWEAGRRPLDTEGRAMATDFLQQVALTVILGEARHEQERLLVYEDRDRIARDLHDLVIQRLFATGMHLQATQRLPDMSPVVSERISRAVDELDETIREIRQTIFALHEPIDAEGRTLRGAVLREAAQSGALLGFTPAVRFIGAIDSLVPRDLAEQVIPVLREALTNAAKHAAATRIDILVEATSERLLLIVTDDGVGVAEGGRRSGLGNIEGRAQELGGMSIVERVSADGGTRLSWSVPLS